MAGASSVARHQMALLRKVKNMAVTLWRPHCRHVLHFTRQRHLVASGRTSPCHYSLIALFALLRYHTTAANPDAAYS